MATSQDIPAENMQDWVEIPTLTITEAPENLSQSNPSTARTSRRQTIVEKIRVRLQSQD
ncbi:hypothetical protein PROFUN_16731, partial [Planoprotostelium fungivorum]